MEHPIKSIFLILIVSFLVGGPVFADQKGNVYWEQNDQNKYRLMSPDGVALTDYRYDKVYEFSHGVANVMIGEAIGLLKDNGKEIAKPIYTFAPLHFGETPIRPSFRGKEWFAGCLYHANLGGATWWDENGKVLQTGTKMLFTINDKIPEGLWDY